MEQTPFSFRITPELKKSIRDYAYSQADEMDREFERMLDEERASAEKCAQTYVAYGR